MNMLISFYALLNLILSMYIPIANAMPESPQTSPVVSKSHETVCVEYGADYWTNYILGLSATPEEKQWLIKTATCESHLTNCADSGYYKGIMQYSPETFKNAGGKNIWDGAEQINLALSYYRVHGSGAWPNCGK